MSELFAWKIFPMRLETSVGLVWRVLSFIMCSSFSLLRPRRDLTLDQTRLGSLLGSMVDVNDFHEFSLLLFTK